MPFFKNNPSNGYHPSSDSHLNIPMQPTVPPMPPASSGNVAQDETDALPIYLLKYNELEKNMDKNLISYLKEYRDGLDKFISELEHIDNTTDAIMKAFAEKR